MRKASASLFVLALVLAGRLDAQTTARTYEVLGFDKAFETVLMRVEDPGVGLFYQARRMFQGGLLEEQMAPKEQEEKILAGLKRKYKIEVDPIKGQETPDKKNVLMGFKDGAQFRLFFMEGSKVGYYDKVDLKQGSKGETGEAYLKENYWTPDGKRFVAVVHQKLASDRIDLDADQFYIFTFKRYKIHFGGDEEKAQGQTNP
jgi:hypothetical protein